MNQSENFSYSRADMLADGTLVNVGDMAKEAGFKASVAVSSALWDMYIQPSEELKSRWGQSVEGRLWDTLCMLSFKIKCLPKHESATSLVYDVLYRTGQDTELVRLKAIIGAGDQGEMVMTILLETEKWD